jgi:uncharacterized protein (DUF2141 family)
MENSRPQGTSAQVTAPQGTTSPETPHTPDPYVRQARRGLSDQGQFGSNPWKDNHGNVLLAFAAILCLIGVSVIAYQQSRFVPPRFPTRLNAPENTGSEGLSTAGETNANATQELRTIQIRIIGAASDAGSMKIATYVAADGFNEPSKALGVDSWEIANGVCVGKFQMPASIRQLAISAYHDENGNGQLDKNSLGIPSERYGFSGGARGLTGPPSFDEAAVLLDDKTVDISIR